MPKSGQTFSPYFKEKTAHRLSELRHARGLTQAKLAEVSGMGTGKVRNIEHALIAIDDKTAEALSGALHVSHAAIRVLNISPDPTSKDTNLAIRYVMEVSKVLGLEPTSTADFAGLRAATRASLDVLAQLHDLTQRNLETLEEGESADVERMLGERLLWLSSTDSPIVEAAAHIATDARPRSFAENLDEVMKKRGITTTALYEATDIPQRTLRTYIQGTRTPTTKATEKLAKALDTVPEALVPIDVTDGESALAALVDIAQSFYLTPKEFDGELYLVTQSRGLEKALDAFSLAHRRAADGDQSALTDFRYFYNDATARRATPSRYEDRRKWRDVFGEHHTSTVRASEWRGYLWGI